jgi:small-conductance mechanosensitive channel
MQVGVAESIRLFSTIFRTDGGAPVEVPNRQLVTLVIQNLSRTEVMCHNNPSFLFYSRRDG